ncbi:uncharacterized protein I303_108602 [Kwoniella dejecticola CBS 10117]|uniref:EamA domain-containing protein n=1 Tax=Kwoniella dejecticola CBS 10117 TaxID=1296121 RepID=A0A1A5ZWY9_9TREE|nr:uncharacterized protein I303_07073 [Kwoniella dejecticola CBS 10117]OBR82314.1 hypothetical protein I303_07073 [Kwoniella dejecticola CBS 10117]
MSGIQSYTHPRTPSQSHIHIPTISLPSASSKTGTSILLPASILIGIVFASAIQTEFTHNLLANIKYDKPYFTFYLTHSTFCLIFPIHLLILKLTTKRSVGSYMEGIKHILIDQLDISSISSISTSTSTFSSISNTSYVAPTLSGVPWKEIIPIWSKKIVYLTMILSIPSLSWYVAMRLSPPIDITSIYSTSAFATYFFSLLLLNQTLSKVTICSIVLAFVGVFVISLDGLTDAADGSKEEGLMGRFVGDSIMLFGAIILGLYEVIYKLALPEGHGGVTSSTLATGYSPLPTHTANNRMETETELEDESHLHENENGSAISQRSSHPYQGTDSTPTPIELTPPLSRTTSGAGLLPSTHLHQNQNQNRHSIQNGSIVDLPPALHANFITSCIGLATLLLLWPPIFLLDWSGYETFAWPAGEGVWTCLAAIFAGGTLYNAGLMVLIGIWGPTTSSVANLLTIGLVALVDSIWLGQIPDGQTLLGVGMICVGFGVLLWEGEG